MPLADEDIFSRICFDFDARNKLELIQNFWPGLSLNSDALIGEEYQALFVFIQNTLQKCAAHQSNFASQSFGGLFHIISKLRSNKDWTKEQLKDYLRPTYTYTEDSKIYRSIELCLRLWMCLDVCSPELELGPTHARRNPIHWDPSVKFKDLVDSQFSGLQHQASASSYQLDSTFTVLNLRKKRGITISWTDSLPEHLRLDGLPGKRVLSIYRHKTSLINHRRTVQDCAIEEAVLDEAINSLDILFPFGHSSTQDFLKDQKVDIYFASPAEYFKHNADPPTFKYWNHRMNQLSDLFYGPPETPLQALLDTRNFDRWVTIWIAVFGILIVTIVFGCFASWCAYKQLELARKSLDVSRKSYDLAKALACLQNAAQLPAFCSSDVVQYL